MYSDFFCEDTSFYWGGCNIYNFRFRRQSMEKVGKLWSSIFCQKVGNNSNDLGFRLFRRLCLVLTVLCHNVYPTSFIINLYDTFTKSKENQCKFLSENFNFWNENKFDVFLLDTHLFQCWASQVSVETTFFILPFSKTIFLFLFLCNHVHATVFFSLSS